MAARAIRLTVLLAPIVLGGMAAIVANHVVPVPPSTPVVLARSLMIVLLCTLVVRAVDRGARKLLPLAALMQLSLVFPDQAPSRFRSALKAGSSRRLEKTLDETRRHGLASNPGDAARQVVQLIGAIGDHDRRTRGHSERVRLFADLVGEELKLSKEERQKLQWGALLHDLGKLMVPAEILNKKGRPDADEWRILQGHPAAGMELIEPLRGFLGEWAHAIGGHHEKWDGSGYPAGLRGTQIPRAAAIVAVADSFEVMTAVRSYKKAMPLPEARAELTRCAGTHFSPEVVRAFLSISLGHLRLVSGPLAALAHLPFLGNLTQLPGAAAAVVPAMANAAALPTAAMMTAAALTVGGAPAQADALQTIATAPESVAAPSGDTGPATRSSTNADGVAAASAAPPDGGTSGAEHAVGAQAQGAAAASASTTTGPPDTTPTTTIATAPAAAGAPATTTTTAAAAPTTAKKSTTTTAVPTTTTPPAPPTTLAPPTSVATSGSTFELQVATNALRLGPQKLHGASFARSSMVYVFAPIAVEHVHYSTPTGTRQSNSYPFDMAGTSLIAANGYRLPSTPGTYTITAVAEEDSSGPGSGSTYTASATFTVT